MIELLKQIIEMLSSFIGGVGDYLNMVTPTNNVAGNFLTTISTTMNTITGLSILAEPIIYMIALSGLFIVVDLIRDML